MIEKNLEELAAAEPLLSFAGLRRNPQSDLCLLIAMGHCLSQKV
jgi:hypothetical protein